MKQLIISKTTSVQSPSNYQFKKSAFYKGYKILNDDSTSVQVGRKMPTLKIVNVSQKEGRETCYTGETIFNVQKEHMQEFYERMNRRFGG